MTKAPRRAAPLEDEPILEEAARWVVRSRAGLSTAERLAFRSWLAERSEHAAAVDAVAGAWRAAPAAAARAGLATPARVTRGRAESRPPAGRSLAAASLAAMSLLISCGWWYANSDAQRFSTGPRQRLVATLADGTQAWLAPGTSVRARFDPLGRRVELAEGEVTLRVAPQRRGFAVEVGYYRIVDRGTLFDVRRRTDADAEVVLANGRIDITDRRSGRLLASPRPGTRVTLDRGAARAAPVDARAAISWHEGRVVLDDLPLAIALARLREQGAAPVTIDDPAIGRLRVSGAFSVDDMRSFLSAVGELHPVAWRRTGRGYELSGR